MNELSSDGSTVFMLCFGSVFCFGLFGVFLIIIQCH